MHILSSHLLIAALSAALLCPAADTAAQKATATQTDVPAKYYRGLTGCFLLFDNNANAYTRYNPSFADEDLSPASTFKIMNALIGLETGVIPDEHYVIPWDSVQRSMPAWNRDHDLASAFSNSVVWYFQEVARRIGTRRMGFVLFDAGYGNCDLSGGIDRFWLGSSLQITANEQMSILRRLYDGNLPFSPRTMDIVKRIMLIETNDSYTLRGKTGFTTDPEGRAIGWFVGWVEKHGNVYFFVMNITSQNIARDAEWIFAKRKEITLSILHDLGVL